MSAHNPVFYLSTDVGGHSVRTSLYDEECNCLARFSEAVAVEKPAPGRVEHSPRQIVEAVRATANECLALLPPAARASMGLATQRSSIVCWRRSTVEPLSAVLSWQDVRGSGYLAACDMDPETLKRKTGLVLSVHYSATKIRWCLEHLSAVADCAPRQLVAAPLGTYLVAALAAQTGEVRVPLIDASNAARTLLFNITDCEWDLSLLRAFAVPEGCLPQVVDNHHDFGIADLSRPVKMRLLIADQSAALFAGGSPEKDTVYINIGSGAFILGLVDSMPADDRLLVSLLYKHRDRRLFALEGTVNGAANALSWFRQQSGATAIPPYHELKPGRADTGCFINAVGGIGSPWWRTDITSRFVDAQTEDAKWMAIYESILFLLYCNFTRIKKHLPGLRKIRLSGGLSSDPQYCQALADLFAAPVVRAQVEATSVGVAHLLGAACRAGAEQEQCFQPRTGRKIYDRFCCWEQQMHVYTAIDNI